MYTPNFLFILLITLNSAISFDLEVKTRVIDNDETQDINFKGDNFKMVIDIPDIYMNGTQYLNKSATTENEENFDDRQKLQGNKANDAVYPDEQKRSINKSIFNVKKWVNNLNITEIKKTVSEYWEKIRQSIENFVQSIINIHKESVSSMQSFNESANNTFVQSSNTNNQSVVQEKPSESSTEDLIYYNNVSTINDTYVNEKIFYNFDEEIYKQDNKNLTENGSSTLSQLPVIEDNRGSSEQFLANVYQNVSDSMSSESESEDTEKNIYKPEKNKKISNATGIFSKLLKKLRESLAKPPNITKSKWEPLKFIAKLLNLQNETKNELVENKNGTDLPVVDENLNKTVEKTTKSERNLPNSNRRLNLSSTPNSESTHKKDTVRSDRKHSPDSSHQIVSHSFGSDSFLNSKYTSEEKLEIQKSFITHSISFGANKSSSDVSKKYLAANGVKFSNENDLVVELIKKLMGVKLENNDSTVKDLDEKNKTLNIEYQADSVQPIPFLANTHDELNNLTNNILTKLVTGESIVSASNKTQFKQNKDRLYKLYKDIESILDLLNTQEAENMKEPYKPENTSQITEPENTLQSNVKDLNLNERTKYNITNEYRVSDKFMETIMKHVNQKKVSNLIEKDSTKILEQIYEMLKNDNFERKLFHDEYLKVLKQTNPSANNKKWDLPSILNVIFVMNNDKTKDLAELENTKNIPGGINSSDMIEQIVKIIIAVLKSFNKNGIFGDLSDESNETTTESFNSNIVDNNKTDQMDLSINETTTLPTLQDIEKNEKFKIDFINSNVSDILNSDDELSINETTPLPTQQDIKINKKFKADFINSNVSDILNSEDELSINETTPLPTLQDIEKNKKVNTDFISSNLSDILNSEDELSINETTNLPTLQDTNKNKKVKTDFINSNVSDILNPEDELSLNETTPLPTLQDIEKNKKVKTDFINSNLSEILNSEDELSINETKILPMPQDIENNKKVKTDFINSNLLDILDSEDELDDSKILLKEEVKGVVNELHSDEHSDSDANKSGVTLSDEEIDDLLDEILSYENISQDVLNNDPLQILDEEKTTTETLAVNNETDFAKIVSQEEWYDLLDEVTPDENSTLNKDILLNNDNITTQIVSNQLDSDMHTNVPNLDEYVTHKEVIQTSKENATESNLNISAQNNGSTESEISESSSEEHNKPNLHDLDPDDYLKDISDSPDDYMNSYVISEESKDIYNDYFKNGDSEELDEFIENPYYQDVDSKVNNAEVLERSNNAEILERSNDAEVINDDILKILPVSRRGRQRPAFDNDKSIKLKRSINNLRNLVYPSISSLTNKSEEDAHAIKNLDIAKKIERNRGRNDKLRTKPKYKPAKSPKKYKKYTSATHYGYITQNDHLKCKANEIRINGICFKVLNL